MVIARKYLIDEEKTSCFHLISRCVRRAYLCGDGFEHRKQWTEERIAELSGLFAIQNLAFAVMSNHLHLAIKTQPDVAESWSAREVAERWLMIYPQAHDDDGNPCLPDQYIVNAYAANKKWISERRKRLRSPSWFMKCLKEPIAKRANKEDGCRGAFWESRFHSVALLDQAALIACMVYIDLNPLRAGMVDIPEQSEHTSITLRTEEWTELQQQKQQPLNGIASDLRQQEHVARAKNKHPWLSDLKNCTVTNPEDLDASTPLTLSEYIRIVDETGRFIKDGKRGSIDTSLAPILARLKISNNNWLTCMSSAAQFSGTAIGNKIARIQEAAKRGVRCIMSKCKLYSDSPPIT